MEKIIFYSGVEHQNYLIEETNNSIQVEAISEAQALLLRAKGYKFETDFDFDFDLEVT